MGNSDKLEKQLAELKEWVVTQLHIPKDMDRIGLLAPAPRTCVPGASQGGALTLRRRRGIFASSGMRTRQAKNASTNRALSLLNELAIQSPEVDVFHDLPSYFCRAKAIPIRLKQLHMVNTPTFIDKLFSIFKQFMSKDMNEMIHFHTTNSDTLYKFIRKDDLPKDFGGKLDSLEVYNKKMVDLLRKHRDNLMNDNLWKAPEKKPKGSSRNKSSPVPETPNDSFHTVSVL